MNATEKILWPKRQQWLALGLTAVVLTHFFVVLGTGESWLVHFTRTRYYIDLIFVTPITFLVLVAIFLQHGYLEKKLPLRAHYARRLGVQFITGVILPSIITFFLVWLYLSQVLHQSISQSTFLIYEFPVSLVVNIVVNLVLVVDTMRKKTFDPVQHERTVSTLLVSKGQRQVPVPVGEIGCIVKDADLTFVISRNNEQYTLNQSLEQLEEVLDKDLFFRANRQTIIHRPMCDHFVPDRSGKITLYIKAPVSRQVVISQKRAVDFRAWLTQ